MKQQTIPLILLFFSFALLSGCTTGGSFLSTNTTNVELSESNFNIVAKNVEGHAKVSYILGVSYSTGNMANTLALVRIDGTAKLYKSAIENLWENYKSQFGDNENKNLVLANVRIDTDMLNLILYTEAELYITADIIEFDD